MRGAIFTTDYEKGLIMLSDIIDGYYNVEIIDDRSSAVSRQIRLANGDSWALVTSRFGAHGRRLNVAYIDRGLGVEFIKEIILPCLICRPFSATHYFGEPKLEEKDYFGLLL